MKINIIAAFAQNRIIGYKNTLPWHIPSDLRRFKQITSGHIVVMGRKTFESIGKPLPKRKNIVLTKDRSWHADGVTIIHDYNRVFDEKGDVFVIGGEKVFELFLPHADKMYLTVIYKAYEGDAYFPSYELEKDFIVESQEDCIDENRIEYSFLDLKKVDEKEKELRRLFPGFKFLWTRRKEE